MISRKVMLTSAIAGLALAGASAAVHAQGQPVELHWWHAMTGVNNDVVNKVADDFNKAQGQYKVIATFKGSYADTMNAGIAAYRAGGAPHIMQVFEVGTATMMGAKGAIKPVHELMAETGEKFDPNAYLPTVTSYYSTKDGRMLSMPFNSSTAIMWYNKDAFKKAGLDSNQPPKTWPEVIDAAKKIRASGHPCGLSTAWVTWTLIEQFSAWHNLPLATKVNGMDGLEAELKTNSPLHVRLVQTLAELQKDKTFDYGGRTNVGEGKFTSGECAIYLNSSAFFGNVKTNAKFEFGMAQLPYFPDAPGAPQNSIIGGASLWVMGGKKPDEYKGVAKFFTFLSDTDRQAWLHQETGYLPITKAALEQTKAEGFYQKNPGRDIPILQMSGKPPTDNSRGLRLGNLVQIRDVWAEELEAAFAGTKTAQAAMDAAVQRGNTILRAFERTAR
ncbi:MAG: sn-glycerol-3-phosphate ABC transporter substrate-binding protein UgpB [Pseudomonadota bacterium]